MKILLFHPTLLPPRDYGGVERVVLWLAQGLIERGHSVSIAALAGSHLPLGCELIEVTREYYSPDALAWILPEGLDLIHFMAPISPADWEKLPVPALLTVHGNGKPGERFPLNSVFLSQNHAKRHRADTYIYNGLNPAELLFEPDQKENSFLFLSKTSWSVKNLHGAMKLCKTAKVPLKIAGGSRPYSKYLECLIRPSLSWIGPVNGIQKSRLLTRAQALVFPVTWDEPFGLVVAESLFSGTPVLASRKGSLPELVPPHVGAVLDTDEEWIETLKNWKSTRISPEACRAWAFEKFHYLQMAENYEKVYARVKSGEKLHTQAPISLPP